MMSRVAMMLDRIVVLGLARGDETRRRRRIVRVDKADLGGLVVVHAEQEEAAVCVSPRPRKKPGSCCSWIERVWLRRADGMAQDLAGAVLVVEPDIEQRPAVGRPFEPPLLSAMWSR